MVLGVLSDLLASLRLWFIEFSGITEILKFRFIEFSGITEILINSTTCSLRQRFHGDLTPCAALFLLPAPGQSGSPLRPCCGGHNAGWYDASSAASAARRHHLPGQEK
jgi:hypothetical protein